MKKKLALIVVCLLCLMTLLTGCGQTPLASVNLEDPVYGNGSYVVRKGDYVYFTDTFIDGTKLEKDGNREGKVTDSALYRTKLVDGALQLNEDGVLNSYEVVVSKVVGHKNCGLFIYDNYIYYTTPNMDYNREGTLQCTLGFLDFCRVKLDGTGIQKLYTTENFDTTNSYYNIYKIGTKVYIVFFDGNNVIKVVADGDNFTSSTLIEKVTGVKMLPKTNYTYAVNNAFSQFDKCVYYTRDLNEDDGYLVTTDKGNILGRIDIVTGLNTELANSTKSTISLLEVKDGYVFYTKDSLVYANDFNKTANSEIQITGTSTYTLSKVLNTTKNGDNYTINGIVVKYQSSTFIINGFDNNGDIIQKRLLDSEITVEFIQGNFMYFMKDSKLCRIDYTAEDVAIETVVNDDTMETTNMVGDADNGYIYFFKKYIGDSSESGVYLTRVNLSNKIQPDTENPILDDENNVKTDLGYEIEVVGILDEKHIVTEEDIEE